MTFHDPSHSDAKRAGPTLADVLDWAIETGEKRDALYELKKVPARLGLIDAEIDLVPADLAHFDKVVAPSPYGLVCRAADVETARRRGNSRLRALLQRFFAAQGTDMAPAGVRESFDCLIDAIRGEEGFPNDGALFATSTHKPLLALRARCHVPLSALGQSEIDRVWAEATPEARKSLRRAIALLARLRRGHNSWPDIAALLPAAELAVPAAPDRARRIPWESLPEPFRADADAVLRETLRDMEDLKSWTRAQLKAGRSPVEIDAAIAEMHLCKRRKPKNRAAAMAGYRQALTWLAREQIPEGGAPSFATVRDLFSVDALEAACTAQIARATASVTLKNPDESSTLWSRVTNLTTIARHGLRDPELLSQLRVVRLLYDDYIQSPDAMTAEAEAVCDRMRLNPHLAARLVNGPARLHAAASEALAEATMGTAAEERALRLFAGAAAHAVQVSRPLRPANLFTIRQRAVEDCPRNLVWIRDGAHAELRFAGAEVKNGKALSVHVTGEDARILWDWQAVHRPRLIALRGLTDSPYLFPGSATPRLRRKELALPPGCMSPAAVVELWDLCDRLLGLGLTPHKYRHAIATLTLAVHPGNFALVAAILGNTEDVARKHYGKDSGEAAAAAVREALLTHHPDIFRRMKGAMA